MNYQTNPNILLWCSFVYSVCFFIFSIAKSHHYFELVLLALLNYSCKTCECTSSIPSRHTAYFSAAVSFSRLPKYSRVESLPRWLIVALKAALLPKRWLYWIRVSYNNNGSLKRLTEVHLYIVFILAIW